MPMKDHRPEYRAALRAISQPVHYARAQLRIPYFFMRKFWFAYLAKGLVIFPGGFGTIDEMMEVLTLTQTQKLAKKMTIVLYGEIRHASRARRNCDLIPVRRPVKHDGHLFATSGLRQRETSIISSMVPNPPEKITSPFARRQPELAHEKVRIEADSGRNVRVGKLPKAARYSGDGLSIASRAPPVGRFHNTGPRRSRLRTVRAGN